MIRINKVRSGSILSLSVEGTVAGEWASELARCWLDSKTEDSAVVEVNVDLSGVTYIDDIGRELLSRMLHDGATIHATGVMNRAIIDELAGEAGHEKDNGNRPQAPK